MTIASVGTLGSGGSASANQSSASLTLTAQADAGNLVVLLVAVDNNQTTDGDEVAITSVSDSAGGNTWTKAKAFTNGQGTAQTGATVECWYSVLTNSIANGGTITVNFSNNTSRDASAMSAWEYTLGAQSTVDVVATNTLANDAADPGSVDAAASVGGPTYLRVRAIAGETNNNTQITVTTNWTAFSAARSSSGTSASQQAIRGEFHISSGTTDPSNPTWTAMDNASVYVTFREAFRLVTGAASYTLSGQAVNFKRTYVFPAGQGSYTLNGQVVWPSIAAPDWLDGAAPVASFPSAAPKLADPVVLNFYTITAAQGSYSLTGQAAGLAYGHQVAAAQGTYTLTGQVVGVRFGHSLPAAQGSYTLTGFDTAGGSARTITAAQGSYSLNGQAAAFARQRSVQAAFGSYSLNGQAALFQQAAPQALGTATAAVASFPIAGSPLVDPTQSASFTIPAARGTYTLTGQAVAMRRGVSITATAGGYIITGAQSFIDYELSVSAGTYTLTGQAVALKAARLISAVQGAYALSGQAAALVRGTYRTIATQGSYALTGQSLTMVRNRPIVIGTGFYALAGQTAGLRRALNIAPTHGVYTLNGQVVGLVRGSNPQLTAETGLFTLSGQAVNFVFFRHLGSDAGIYTLSGQSVGLARQLRMAAAAGSYALAGEDAAFRATRQLAATAGSFALTGEDAALMRTRSLAAQFGVYALAGEDVILTATADQGATFITGLIGSVVRRTSLIGRVSGGTELGG